MLRSLRLLEGFDLKQMGLNSTDYIHVVTEAMKLAFADRDEYLADPDFADVPLTQMLSDQYTLIRRLFSLRKFQVINPVRPADLRKIKHDDTGIFVNDKNRRHFPARSLKKNPLCSFSDSENSILLRAP